MSKAHLRAIVEGRASLGPETIHVDLTNGCNTNCVTCWDHSPLLSSPRAAAWKRQRVEPEAIERLIDDALGLGGLRAVIVSGMGEPFTHPDVWRILTFLKSKDLHVTVITNLIAADAQRIVELGVDQLLIGIHAASEGAYRAFHPSFERDEWWRLLAMLERFRRAGRRFKHVHVIARCNAHELVEMVRLHERWPAAQINFKLASLAHGTEASRIDESQRAKLLDDLLPRARDAAAALGVETNLDVFERQLRAGGGDTAPIDEIGCYMGYVYARVLVDGTVLFCCNTEVRVGSLQDAPFSTLWRGEAWDALRARMRSGDFLPSCRQCGKVNQNVKLARKLREKVGDDAFAAMTSVKRRHRLPIAPDGGAS